MHLFHREAPVQVKCAKHQNKNTPLNRKALTVSAEPHGFSIFPALFQTFLRICTKIEAIGFSQINSYTCLPVLLLPVAFVNVPKLHAISKSCRSSSIVYIKQAAIRARLLTVAPVQFDSIDPAAPRLSQHDFWTRQGSTLRTSRHCCGGFSPLELLLL